MGLSRLVILVAEEDCEYDDSDAHDASHDDISNVQATPAGDPLAGGHLLVVVTSSRLLLLSTRLEQWNGQEVDQLPQLRVVLQLDQRACGSSFRNVFHKNWEF